jgi:hypothetical protein
LEVVGHHGGASLGQHQGERVADAIDGQDAVATSRRPAPGTA